MMVRPMAREHLAALAVLERTCFARPWSEAALAEELENPTAHFFVALEGDEVVGYIGMHAVLDEGAVTNVAVRPDRRRQGIASALLRHAAVWGAANGLHRLTLEVRAGNAAAIALYERQGWVCDGVRPRFYDRPVEDAMLYSLYI